MLFEERTPTARLNIGPMLSHFDCGLRPRPPPPFLPSNAAVTEVGAVGLLDTEYPGQAPFPPCWAFRSGRFSRRKVLGRVSRTVYGLPAAIFYPKHTGDADRPVFVVFPLQNRLQQVLPDLIQPRTHPQSFLCRSYLMPNGSLWGGGQNSGMEGP